MRRISGLVLVVGLAFSLAGCATGQFGGSAATSGAASSQDSSAVKAENSPGVIRDFDLRVRCPGIHLEKTRLGWSEEKIMKHESVTRAQISRCEAWADAQPTGYVPPPPSPISPPTSDMARQTQAAQQSTTSRK